MEDELSVLKYSCLLACEVYFELHNTCAVAATAKIMVVVNIYHESTHVICFVIKASYAEPCLLEHLA